MSALVMLAALLLGGGTLQGVVRVEGTGEPVPRAMVHIPALGRAAMADARGFYVLPDMPAGRHRVEARAVGHRPALLTVASDGTGTVHLDFDLVVQPVRVAGVEVHSTPVVDTVATVAVLEPGPVTTRLPAYALRTMPGLLEPDVLRALQAQPSVGAISDYSSALYVRGGVGDQNLITVDGIPLFNPYHLGGIFSAIAADAVSYVDLRPGALPASLGDRLSGAVTINTRTGARDRVHARGMVGLLSSQATVDGPLPGGEGSFLLSGRRTYLDAVADAAYGVGLLDMTIPYGFWDVLARASHPVGERGTLTFTGILNREHVYVPERMREDAGGTADFDWGSRLAVLGYRQSLGGGVLLDARLGLTDFSGGFDAWSTGWSGLIHCTPDGGCDYSGATRDSSHVIEAVTGVRDVVLGVDLTRFGRRHTLRAGAQVDAYRWDNAILALDDFDGDYVTPFSQAGSLTTLAAYAEDEWSPSDRVRIRGGLRVLHGEGLGTAALPRIGARWQVTPALSLSAGAGMYAQAIRSLKDEEAITASIIAYDVFAGQPEDVGLARSRDAVLGAEYVRGNVRVGVEGYVRGMSGLVLGPEPDEPLEVPPLVVDDYRVGSGRAHGLEISGRTVQGALELGAAYSLAWTRRSLGEWSYVPRFDRRHRLDLTVSRGWGATGLFTAHLALGTGQPYSPVVGLAPSLQYDTGRDVWVGGQGGRAVLGEYNSARLPGYLRLDVAARKTFERRWFGRAMQITPVVQVVNVLNTRNTLIAEPETWGGPRLTYWPQLPFLPSVGLEWSF